MRFIAAAVATALWAGGAIAAEKTVDFQVDGKKIVATLNVPDGAAKPPAILLLHGFTGSRNELEIPAVKEGIFARAARMWAERASPACASISWDRATARATMPTRPSTAR